MVLGQQTLQVKSTFSRLKKYLWVLLFWRGIGPAPGPRVLNVITPTHLDSLFSPRYLDTIGIGASLFIHISQLSYTMTTNSISSRLAKAKQNFLEVIPF